MTDPGVSGVPKIAGAVIVAYFPDPDVIARITRLSRFVQQLVVVDNTPGGAAIELPIESAGNVRLLVMMENMGIAFALNIGIKYLLDAGCGYVFLFDQDSDVTSSALQALLDCCYQAQQVGQVAQVGPAYFDRRLGRLAPFIRREGLRIRRLPAQGEQIIRADYLITSGACITREAWNAVGPMDDSLFIDFVDIEWGLRANALGWASYGCPQIVMQHTLGEEPISVFGRRYPLHSPLRHYYFVRNGIALMRRSYVPLCWKLIELTKLPIRFVVYGVFADNGAAHFKMMLSGLWHGMIGRSGRR
ncbi:glycosyltransferase family 2 protein [Silvimonas soli]|uniref:glycosyltransferase family 2 protein n=1 Tax=Silvimonas soli TaxID=2980100 RepID=UPI0024B33BC8|nr:glycosyltransferase family 2 protein [Silvimonas soli]